MIPPSIKEKLGKDLHNQPHHPLQIIKEKIFDCFPGFMRSDNLPRVVSVKENFDDLLVPKDHVSRNPSDTFYTDDSHVLRTHTSAHQSHILKNMSLGDGALIVGDVYRRDTIDRFHYPVFHQMEGLKIVDNPAEDLKENLVRLVTMLFGEVEYRIVESYFPFTDPSWEFEIKLNDQWVEVLGCGCIRKEILQNAGFATENGFNTQGWAFGLGLERLAMILFKIPDIRYFWTEDRRFLDQFQNGKITEFIPYSKYPFSYKDIAFWTGPAFNLNDFCEEVREIGGDLVEDIQLIDTFAKNDRTSLCYRITYRALDRSLTNDEVNVIQEKIRNYFIRKGLEVR